MADAIEQTTGPSGGGESAAPAVEPRDDFDIPIERDTSTGQSTGSRQTAPAPTETPVSAPTEPAQAPAATTQPTTPAPLPPALVSRLREAGLREAPGETIDQAHDRLYDHLRARGSRFYNEAREQQRLLQQIAQETQAQRQALEPIIRDYYRREQAAKTEELAAQIPDPDVDPDAYRTWLAEEQLRRDDARRDEEMQRAEVYRQQQEQAQYQAELARLDETSYSAVAQGLGLVPGVPADTEFVTAYDAMTKATYAGWQTRYPDASPDDLAELTSLSQQIDMRRYAELGYDPRVVIKGQAASLRQLLGGANGNGHQPQQQAQPVQPQQAPAPQAQPQSQPQVQAPQPSPTAVRSQAAAAAVRAHQPLSPPPSARPATTGTLPDIGEMDEEDYVEAVLNNMIPLEDRIGMHRKTP